MATGRGWHQVLAALYDTSLDSAEREVILGHGAARLAVHRAAEGEPPTAQDVISIAFAEFTLLLDPDTARHSLLEVTPADG